MAENFQTNDRAIEPPLIVQNGHTISWDEETDVVVVGFGGAGASAAIEARESGADVIALDRFGGGGATAFSGGVIYAGGGTSIQHEAGVADSPEEMAKYLALEVGNAVTPETIQRYAEGSRQELEWLMKHGVPFDSTFYKEKIVYPPEGYFLQYSGNEKAYARHALPAARGHRTVGAGFTGVVLFEALRRAADRLGVKLLSHTPVTRLVMDETGRVIGVEAHRLDAHAHKQHQKLYDRVNPMAPFNAGPAARSARAAVDMEGKQARRMLIRARRGVVLSTGGFSHNMEMLHEHVPFIARNVHATMRMASLGCNGSGIRLGESAGGASRALNRVYLGRVMAPPSGYLSGVMVNRRGERFVSEDAYNSIIGQAILAQPGGEARLVLTGKLLLAVIRECLFSGWATFRYFGGAALLNILFGGTRHAGSLARLAQKCGMDPATLEHTIARYNETIGGEDDFGKLPDTKTPISGRSYHAINFSIPNRFAFSQLFTMGGLRVDENTGQVLRDNGSAIQGLYAAGRTAYGLCSNNYVSGLSIGDCVFSGRRAARHCATERSANS